MQPARLLDVTRLASRAGRGALTGIDRVERAWLGHLLGLPDPVFGLVRTRLGFLLLERAGLHLLREIVDGVRRLDAAEWLSSFVRRKNPRLAAVESALRRIALARSTQIGLARMIHRHLPTGSLAVNIGHSNLAHRTLRGLRRAGLRLTVMIHDCIPLDFPQLARQGTPAVFARKLAAVARHATLVLHTTEAQRAMTEAHLRRAGRVPDGIVAPLGVPVPQPGTLPPTVTPPFFLTLGTIEPRKNHALLLDLWQRAAAQGHALPTLCIVGQRGWADPSLLARLDAGVPGVVELGDLPDATVAALMAQAQALLFPTLAEGYGLPPAEAAALGTPVVCSDLPVLREVMGDYPVYLDPSDSYSWGETIVRLAQARDRHGTPAGERRPPPDWADHFNAVLSRT